MTQGNLSRLANALRGRRQPAIYMTVGSRPCEGQLPGFIAAKEALLRSEVQSAGLRLAAEAAHYLGYIRLGE